MASRFGFRATLNCSYAAYIVQASVNNIAPILYIIMMRFAWADRIPDEL